MTTIYDSAAWAGIRALQAGGHQEWVDAAGSFAPFHLFAVAVISTYNNVRDIDDFVRRARTLSDIPFAARTAIAKFDRDGNGVELTDAEMAALREAASKAVPF